MDHGYYQDRLSAFSDRSLTLEEMRMIEEHVADCADCRRRLDDLARLGDLIEEKSPLADSDYWEGAAQKIEQRLGFGGTETKVTEVRRSWTGLGWKLAAAAASIAALTFVALHEGDILDSTEKKTQTELAPSPSTTVQFGGTLIDSVGSRDRAARMPAPGMAEESVADKRQDTELAEQALEVKTQAAPPRSKREPTDVIYGVTEDEIAPAADIEPSAVEPAKPEAVAQVVLRPTSGVSTISVGESLVQSGAGSAVASTDSVAIRAEGEVAADREAEKAPIVLDLDADKDLGKTITVMAERDVIDKFEVSNQMAAPRESPATADTSLTLDYWRRVRDSLTPPETIDLAYSRAAEKPKTKRDKSLGVAPLTIAPSADTVSDKPSPLERYLEACYRIALMTDDDAEFDAAVKILDDHAAREDSPGRKSARRYIELLEDQFKE